MVFQKKMLILKSRTYYLKTELKEFKLKLKEIPLNPY